MLKSGPYQKARQGAPSNTVYWSRVQPSPEPAASPAREPVEESEFEKWVKTRPWYPLFHEARPWYPDEKPSP